MTTEHEVKQKTTEELMLIPKEASVALHLFDTYILELDSVASTGDVIQWFENYGFDDIDPPKVRLIVDYIWCAYTCNNVLDPSIVGNTADELKKAMVKTLWGISLE